MQQFEVCNHPATELGEVPITELHAALGKTPVLLRRSFSSIMMLACIFTAAASIYSAANAQSTFLSPQTPISLFAELGETPQSATIADVNADGGPDILIANSGSDDVTVLLADGEGSFEPALGSPFPTGEGPGSLATADFNGDGSLDLVSANFVSDDVSILFGDGAGSFSASESNAVAAGDGPDSVFVNDINGDGEADLVIANLLSENVTVLLGDGMGGFAEAGGSPVAISGRATQAVAAQVNEDAAMDLVVANRSSNSVSIWLGDGSGGFVPASGSPFAVGNDPRDLTVIDLNNDGALDVATVNSDGISVLLGDETGEFSEAAGSPFTVVPGGFGGTRSIDSGDFNADGNVDLAVVSTFVDEIAIFLGDGTGSLSPAMGSPFSVFNLPQSLSVGDLDSDGLLDVLVVHGTNRLSILEGDGNGQLSESSGSPVVFGVNPVGAQTGDFDSDGEIDLAILRSSQDEVLVLDGSGSAQSQPAYSLSGVKRR